MDDAEIRALNREFRDIDRPTNVLSFPMQEGEFSNVTPGLLGDVVISAQTAAAEAEEAGIPLDQRLSQLLVHGILHLVGFDHETGEEDARHMEIKSLELLKRIEPDNPDLPVF
jgi:probable rRNA maturation factor